MSSGEVYCNSVRSITGESYKFLSENKDLKI
jgi:hypothetical protein